jgi:hypothetical protein
MLATPALRKQRVQPSWVGGQCIDRQRVWPVAASEQARDGEQDGRAFHGCARQLP